MKGGDLLATLRATIVPAKTPAPALRQRDDLADAMMRRARIPPPPTKQAALAKKAQGAKGKKVRIKLPTAAKAAVLAEIEAFERTAPQRPPGPVPFYDFGRSDFERIARLRDRLDDFVASHGAPSQVSAATAITIDRRIAVGAEIRVDQDDGFFVGLDFGTSTTKAVLRHPYRRIAYAVPVPEDLATDRIPHLWPTAVFIDQHSGTFGLCPAADRTALTGFKSALIERKGNRICNGSGITMAEAATAFVALYLAQAFGTLLARDADAAIAGIHVALPVAALADQAGKASFDGVVRAALRLIPVSSALTIDLVRAAAHSDEPLHIEPELHTELAGAIAGYCSQPRRFEGAHMIVDCGSATLDIAGFQLAQGHEWPIGIHSARVERLGADACLVYQSHLATAAECRSASRFQEHVVYTEAHQRDPRGFGQAEDGYYPYQMILVGGGMAGGIHAALFDGMESRFQQSFQRPAIARDLDCDQIADPTRLIIADGLARDPISLRQLVMPGDRPAPLRPSSPEMITKDQV